MTYFNTKIKTRFAPSPTGYMHVGNIRTALFCWLHAKKMLGDFYIRIDDTDKNRNSKIYTQNIFDTLNWLKLKSEKNIIFQSNNYKKYKIYLEKLLNEKKAYKCFCTKERLTKLRLKQISNKENIKYDNFCKNKKYKKNISNFIIRFNHIEHGYTEFNDIVKGKIKISNQEFDDFIIAKKDFIPTYNFACAIDDITMQITDIIRGEDHITNTPKQINLIKALNAKVPRFIHLPMILDENKILLSKRNNKTHINFYKNNGFLPQAILNYLIKLGWSYKNKEIFSLNEMISLFNLNNINKSACMTDNKKLIWLNKHYIKLSTISDITKYIIPIEKQFNLNYQNGPTIKSLITFNKNRVNNLREIITDNLFLYNKNINITKELLNIYFSKKIIKLLSILYNKFKILSYQWNIENIKNSINKIAKEYNIEIKEINIPLRILIIGNNISKPTYEIIFLSGRILILKKIITIIKKVKD